MIPDKKNLINHLHTLVSHNVIGDAQCMSRFKGFISELHYEQFLKSKNSTSLKGGNMISRSSKESSLIDSVYFTTISECGFNENYNSLYKKLSALNFKRMFLICYSSFEKWETKPVMIFENKTISLPVPEMHIYEYSKNKNTFTLKGNNIDIVTNCFRKTKSRTANKYPVAENTKKWFSEKADSFDIESITDIYVTRLIFDGYIGFSVKKGKPSDIDFITYKNNKFQLIEIKEKDLPKSAHKGFGLDIPRINDFNEIEKTTGLKYVLIVRHINNQTDRDFINWKWIYTKDFIKNTEGAKAVEGGYGMRGKNTRNPTLICPLKHFKTME